MITWGCEQEREISLVMPSPLVVLVKKADNVAQLFEI